MRERLIIQGVVQLVSRVPEQAAGHRRGKPSLPVGSNDRPSESVTVTTQGYRCCTHGSTFRLNGIGLLRSALSQTSVGFSTGFTSSRYVGV